MARSRGGRRALNKTTIVKGDVGSLVKGKECGAQKLRGMEASKEAGLIPSCERTYVRDRPRHGAVTAPGFRLGQSPLGSLPSSSLSRFETETIQKMHFSNAVIDSANN